MVRASGSPDKSFLWHSDSGATSHVTGRRDWLTDYVEFQTPAMVSLTANNQVRALGKGTVKVEAFIQGEWLPCKIEDVIYIPGAVNLFSDQKGFRIVRENNRTMYSKFGREG